MGGPSKWQRKRWAQFKVRLYIRLGIPFHLVRETRPGEPIMGSDGNLWATNYSTGRMAVSINWHEWFGR